MSTDLAPHRYIYVSEVATFSEENTSDAINSICHSMVDKCWVVGAGSPRCSYSAGSSSALELSLLALN
ncbi:hypothetical protein DPMN_049579 [Dreissena polymorpha]|uniref:Uncharacterized protein n=1 Tax=Dreissena polymorpha TaxID=45954 RepID=A0A9D4CG63_DREPO|nr:hypothetical protein DPMN_049579 [Dreissena polymorpha]